MWSPPKLLIYVRVSPSRLRAGVIFSETRGSARRAKLPNLVIDRVSASGGGRTWLGAEYFTAKLLRNQT